MVFLTSFFAIAGLLAAQEPPQLSTSTVMPSYVALTPNIRDFKRFADGGPDGNWYIGYNNAWIVKLPPAPVGEFSHAFIGARVGRAKTRANPNRPWERELIDGKIYMGLSQTPAFSSQQSFFLVQARDLSVEPDPSTFVEGVGPAQWYWTEVPLPLVSFTQPNYLVIWSPSEYFTRASSAPILAAAEIDAQGGQETHAWNNRSILGVPPRIASNSLETPINNISPALAIKLVPPSESEIVISEFAAQDFGKKIVVSFSVAGQDISEAWVEASRDQLDWERISKIERQQPFLFTLKSDRMPGPGSYLRAAARDVTGAVGTSSIYEIPYAPRQ
jgi:hypothetical protein